MELALNPDIFKYLCIDKLLSVKEIWQLRLLSRQWKRTIDTILEWLSERLTWRCETIWNKNYLSEGYIRVTKQFKKPSLKSYGRKSCKKGYSIKLTADILCSIPTTIYAKYREGSIRIYEHYKSGRIPIDVA